MCSAQAQPRPSICCEQVAQINHSQRSAECHLVNGSTIKLSQLIAAHISPGDEISIPLAPFAVGSASEIYVSKKSSIRPIRNVYQAQIGYVTRPKKDKRDEFFVAAKVHAAGLGIASIFIPCVILREYFYRLPQNADLSNRQTLYEILRAPSTASPGELRVAFRLRQLELDAARAQRSEHVLIERAFNIVGDPELRACYDALLKDAEAPALFPYGGFGSLLVSGERSRDGKTFFAHCIIAFLPGQNQRRFHAPLRKCDFHDDRALYRDVRRKLELWIDHAVLHEVWDATWNQWKHLVATKMEVNATFVKSGKYRRSGNEWQLVTWETALPSRLQINVPGDFQQQIEAAKRAYHRFGQYSVALDKIRARIEDQPVERVELERMLSALNVPGDFDIAQINWRPDYDPFFYRQLSHRARHIYLFRDEYIFDLNKIVVVETPQLGNATYLFSKPHTLESFLAMYAAASKEDIRHNRENVGEKLGFLGRIIHGRDPRSWAKELRAQIGETPDFSATVSAP